MLDELPDQELFAIEFTEYVRPHGRRETVHIERPRAVYDKAQAILAAGFHLEAEALSTGHASFTIADRKEEVDVDIEVVPNGPGVAEAVDRMIMRFDPEAARARILAGDA